MLTSKAERAAKRTTKLQLAMAIAALCMTAVPLAGALAQDGSRQISAGRARPFTSAACWPHGIRNTIGATPKFISIGPVWPDVANPNDSHSASGRRRRSE
jgi:hypothetical protein